MVASGRNEAAVRAEHHRHDRSTLLQPPEFLARRGLEHSRSVMTACGGHKTAGTTERHNIHPPFQGRPRDFLSGNRLQQPPWVVPAFRCYGPAGGAEARSTKSLL